MKIKDRSGQTWSAEEDTRLREMWLADELSTMQMSKLLGRSKNALINRAERIGLPHKPSPIKPAGTRKTSNAEIPWHVRQEAVRLPQLASISMPAPGDIERRTAQAAAYEIVPQVVDFVALPIPPAKTCQWPMWGDGKPTHRYCESEPVSPRPYCHKHCAVAYVREARAA